jgi:hypothetical protein
MIGIFIIQDYFVIIYITGVKVQNLFRLRISLSRVKKHYI